MQIALLEPLRIPDSMLDKMSAPLLAQGHDLTIYDQKPASVSELVHRARDMEAVILANTPFPAEAIAACPRLRFIDVAFTGVDHIAMNACRMRNILVSNAANYSNQTVAELVVGMAVSLLRRLPACDRAARAQGTGGMLTGREIAGRTVGIIGMGRIGLRVARLFGAFGARIIAYDPTPSDQARALGVHYDTLNDVLRASDIVTLHAPANEKTHKMLGAKQFALMKPSAIFINCARGALVDAEALRDALNQYVIAGAAVDVFDTEPPLPADEPLLHAQNMLLTPHIAYASEESMLRRARIVFDNLNAFLHGEPVNLC